VCTLVFLDCAHLFPDIPRLIRGFPRYSRLVRGFSGLCTPFSSVHSHILVCTLVFLDCAHLFLVCTVSYSETVHTSFNTPRLVEVSEIFRDLLEVLDVPPFQCAQSYSSVHTSFSGLCTPFLSQIVSET